MKIQALIGSRELGATQTYWWSGTARRPKLRPFGRKGLPLHYQILPCIDCRRCKKDNFACTLLDGMSETYSKLERADLLI